MDFVCEIAKSSFSDCRLCKFNLSFTKANKNILPKLAWFLFFAETDSFGIRHLNYMKAAINSQRLYANSISPFVVSLNKIKNEEFTNWLDRHNIPLYYHKLSFYDKLPKRMRLKRSSNLNVGAFGRIDIGLVVDKLRIDLIKRGLDPERILYTDTDVLFARDIDYNYLKSLHLSTFAAGTELFSPSLNTGVMFINTTTFLYHHKSLVSFGIQKNFRFVSYDQTWIQQYFSKYKWIRLKDEEYNARAFLHPIKNQVAPRIWHFHGYKPQDVECWYDKIKNGKWPLRAWKDTIKECTKFSKPKCKFLPILNSGCRHFGVISNIIRKNPCYLRTYLFLWEQYLKMLQE